MGLATCAKCGHENKEGARFCIKCGSALAAQAQPTAGTQPGQAPAPPQAPQYGGPPYPTQPTYQQPTAYPQAPPAQPGYPAAAYRGAAPASAGTFGGRKTIFWIGAAVVLLAGILVMVSSFMPWFYGATGWDGFSYNSGFDKVFGYNDGYPLFTGMGSLILGILLALVAVFMLITRSKGLGVVAIILSILALGMAITNVTSIVRGDSIGIMQVGMYFFLIFSFTGLVGAGMSMSG
jgi:hypothetical protein